MITAKDVAKFIVYLFNDEEEGITNLKLQKLLFYAQGFSYQRTGKPLFNDEIEAWENGPVVNSVYQKYKTCGSRPIGILEKVSLPYEETRLLLDVVREYGKYTSSALVTMTHAKNMPWTKVHVEGKKHIVIPKDLIKVYFENEAESLKEFDLEQVFSPDDYQLIDSNTVIPVSEWNYE